MSIKNLNVGYCHWLGLLLIVFINGISKDNATFNPWTLFHWNRT